MDQRWLRGGWTSHFVWNETGTPAYLDVSGVPPRGSSVWQSEVLGAYAGRHTVAEMKRTDRERDWPFATALGAQMVQAGDSRGWLHIFDEELLRSLSRSATLPLAVVQARPVLEPARREDPRLRGALHAEAVFWRERDRVRLQVYRQALRSYVRALKRTVVPVDASLEIQHEVRVLCAEKNLPPNPLADYGAARLLQETTKRVADLVNPAALPWLPSVEEKFILPAA